LVSTPEERGYEGPVKHTVLVVDDESVIADTLRIIFANAGYDARAVYNAELALALLNEGEWLPQAAIIDVCLPEMNGIDLAIVLKGLCPGCRVSLFSGHSETADLLDAAQQNGHTFPVMAKPVHPEELLRVTAQMLSSDTAAATKTLPA
jgi:DNA-binding NtrC family response regulator